MSKLSPARQAHLAAVAFLSASQDDAQSVSAQQKLKIQLHGHKVLLKAIQSIYDKAAFKAQILPEYQGYIDGLLEAGTVKSEDQEFNTLLLWTIDSGDLNRATDMALLVLAQPDSSIAIDGFERTAHVTIFEEIAEQLTRGASIDSKKLQMLLTIAQQRDNSRHQIDMPDKVRAKFFKAAAETIEQAGKQQQALSLYKLALEYDANIGVKTKIKNLEKAE